MAKFNPISNSVILRPKDTSLVYTCPKTASGAEINLTLNSTVAKPEQPMYLDIYVADNTEEPKESDLIMVNIPIGIREYSPEISMIEVGPSQSVFVRLRQEAKHNVAVTVTGLQYESEDQLVCGKVYGKVTSTLGVKEIYHNDNPLISGFEGTVSVSSFNSAVDVHWYLSKDPIPSGTNIPAETHFIGMMSLEPDETVLGEDIVIKHGYRLTAHTNAKKVCITLSGQGFKNT